MPTGCTTCCAPTPRPRTARSWSSTSIPSRSRPRRTARSASGSIRSPLDGGASAGYFGIAGTNSTDDVDVIPTLSPEREPFLEYDLTRMVNNLANPDKPVVALVTDLPLNADPAMQYRPWQVMQELQQFFDVRDRVGRHRPVRRRCRRGDARPSAGAEREDGLRDRPVRDARRQAPGVRRPALGGAGDAPAAARHARRHLLQPGEAVPGLGHRLRPERRSSATRSRRARSSSPAAAGSRSSTICPGSRSTGRTLAVGRGGHRPA